MTNLKDLDTNAIMQRISEFAPFALMVFAMLSFLAVGIFTVDYYEQLLSPRFGNSSKAMAILCAVIQEAVRFGLLIASIRDFSDSKPMNGWLGLAGSIGLVIHDFQMARDIAVIWSAQDPSPYIAIMNFLIATGLLLELRLILTAPQKKVLSKAPKNGIATKKSIEQVITKN